MNGRSDPPNASRTPARVAPTATPGWRESLPFLLGGGVALGVAVALLAVHSHAAIAHLPVWTCLLALGSIALVGGTVATFIGEPIPDLPEENELIGQDLIVVSRARWKDLNKMERWVEDRLVQTPAPVPSPPPRAAPPSAPRRRPTARAREGARPRTGIRTSLRAVPDPTIPTIDDLLADLPPVSDEELRAAELWRETDESRESPQPSLPPLPHPAPDRAAGARPRTEPPAVPASSTPPIPANAMTAAARTRPAAPSADLEQLLGELETEAVRAVEEKQIETALPTSDLITCAGCGRGVAITEPWEHCDECLEAYCARCDDRVARVGDRRLCENCRRAGRKALR